MNTETIYLGRDNSIDLILTVDDVPEPLTAVTKMAVIVGAVTVESTNGATAPIRWAGEGYDTGEVRLVLGMQTIPEGKHEAALVVYDAANPEGVVWTTIRVQVKRV